MDHVSTNAPVPDWMSQGLPSREDDLPPTEGMNRRSALKLIGGALALTMGVTGCDRKPTRHILSRVAPPEYMKPGNPLYYSSTWTDGTIPYGIVIKTVDGRPLAIEGAPENPLNQGKASAQMKASILSLYDPDRLRAPLERKQPASAGAGKKVTWMGADEAITTALRQAKSTVLMTRSTLGPSARAMITRFLAACPGSRHLVHESVHDRGRRAAWSAIYGGTGELIPRLSEARVVVSLDCDFLGTDGAVLEATRQFANTRTAEGSDRDMSRLYVAEAAMTLTGMNADHRLRLRPSAQHALVRGLRAALKGDETGMQSLAAAQGMDPAVLKALLKDLKANNGRALVMAGPALPESVHAEVALLNESLGAPGKTLSWNPSPHALAVDDPATIAAALEGGVDVLLMVDVNPVYDWPGGGFSRLMGKAGLSIGCDLTETETLAACHLALPNSHNLESWDDAAPRPGTRTLCQPVIRPLYESRQWTDSLLRWTKALAPEDPALQAAEEWHDFVKASWQRDLLRGGGEDAWHDVLRQGGRFSEIGSPRPQLDRAAAERLARAQPGDSADIELVVRPGGAIHDGRFGNNPWLQELPDVVSRLVWDNAAALSPKTASVLGLKEGDRVTLRGTDGEVTLPVLHQPGTAERVIVVTQGHGRSQGGEIAPGVGVCVAPIAAARSVQVTKASGRHELVRTQKQFSMQDRPIALDGTLDEYRKTPGFVASRRHLPPKKQIHEEFEYKDGPKWGMSIDLSSCVGCDICVAACTAENNIPVVGKEECGKGREMHWMRIDLYQEGDEDNPTFHQQPLICQHCDNAPCESVCPVQATTQSPEGLNEMTYNRCVGTRYCANNCPYKVRRYNFFDYQDRNLRDPVQELAFNPNVTVRSVGVMEKCTFCVQRISAVRHQQKQEGAFEPADGSIQPACQQACPADAIVFGNLNDKGSRVSRQHAHDRAYYLLEELNVKPSVAYLAKLRNPHPDVAAARQATQKKGDHR